jgi:hypothetical protein
VSLPAIVPGGLLAGGLCAGANPTDTRSCSGSGFFMGNEVYINVFISPVDLELPATHLFRGFFQFVQKHFSCSLKVHFPELAV